MKSAPPTVSSSSKKLKPLKKPERGSKLTDRSNLNLNTLDASEEKFSTEPYKCTGRFIDDFQIICKQNQLAYIPTVIHRPKLQNPNATPAEIKREEKLKEKGKKTTLAPEVVSVLGHSEAQPTGSAIQRQLSVQQSAPTDHDEIKEIETEPLPKTFILVKDNVEYFKPKIQVEQEYQDRVEVVTEIFIRGWRLESSILNSLHQTLPFCEKLTSFNLWYCGLNDASFESLLALIPQCANLKNLNLDGNPIGSQNYHKLIIGESKIQHLSLRNCGVTDLGASKLGISLGTVKVQNTKLITLNLSFNAITDIGVTEIAKGLRTNRTLLVLNLSSNDIGDEGALRLAETLSRFKMSLEEILYRRAVKKERLAKEAALLRKSRTESERPSSLAHKSMRTSSEKFSGKKEKGDASGSTLKDRSKSKENMARESSNEGKQSSAKPKKEKEKDSNSTVSGSNLKKEKDNNKLRETTTSVTMLKSAATTLTKGGRSSKGKGKDSDSNEENSRHPSGKESTYKFNFNNDEPLMDEAEGIDGDLWLTGNRTLISLNLSRNHITELAVKEFLLCVRYQTSLNLFHRTASSFGLFRLNLTKNAFPPTLEEYVKLMDMMKTKDPLTNKNNMNESINEKDNMSVASASKDAKETGRSKSSKHKDKF